MRDDASIDRREFLRRGVVTGLGIGVVAAAEAPAAVEPPSVRRYVTLGRTGLRVSDIGFGTTNLVDEIDVVHHAFDRGINYFDTSDIYAEGDAERALGRALKDRRDKVVLTSKWMAPANATREEITQHLEGSLRRLQTDYVDIYFNHAVNEVARLENPEWGEFAIRAKERGLIRFEGMSGHGPNLIECLNHAFDHDLVDVVLSAYNYAQDASFYQRLKYAYQQLYRNSDSVAYLPEIPETLAKGKRKGVGIVCMKTLRGGRINDLRAYEAGRATFAQAALRWVLSNPDVDSTIISMKTVEQVDEYLGASGWTQPRAGDLGLLRRYEERNGSGLCLQGCNGCAGACPDGVPIADVLRSRMYAREYAAPGFARQQYAALGAAASACLGCAHKACTGACPYGLEIDALTRDTHRLLG